jgi:hypothetical protein
VVFSPGTSTIQYHLRIIFLLLWLLCMLNLRMGPMSSLLVPRNRVCKYKVYFHCSASQQEGQDMELIRCTKLWVTTLRKTFFFFAGLPTWIFQHPFLCEPAQRPNRMKTKINKRCISIFLYRPQDRKVKRTRIISEVSDIMVFSLNKNLFCFSFIICIFYCIVNSAQSGR